MIDSSGIIDATFKGNKYVILIIVRIKDILTHNISIYTKYPLHDILKVLKNALANHLHP